MHGDPPVRDVHEFGLIEKLAGIVDAGTAITGVGDDAAVLQFPHGESLLLATTDALVEGEHFLLERADPEALGRKAIAINVSDVAAMGGTPAYGLSSIAVRDDLSARWLERLYRGIRREADRYGLEIVGGNVARIRGPIVIDITLLGTVAPQHVMRRTGAVPGDVLAVTGSLGGSLALRLSGDRPQQVPASLVQELSEMYLVPEPPLEAAKALAGSGVIHSAMDLSDGLGSDVRRLGKSSSVGAVIHAGNLPISAPVRRLAQALELDVTSVALYGGEDYQLLVTLPPSALEAAVRVANPVPLAVVGAVTGTSGEFVLEGPGGRREALRDEGWRHF